MTHDTHHTHQRVHTNHTGNQPGDAVSSARPWGITVITEVQHTQ